MPEVDAIKGSYCDNGGRRWHWQSHLCGMRLSILADPEGRPPAVAAQARLRRFRKHGRFRGTIHPLNRPARCRRHDPD